MTLLVRYNALIVTGRVCRGRSRNLAKGKAYLEAGNRSAAHACFTKAVEVTPEMCFELIEVGCSPPSLSFSRLCSHAALAGPPPFQHPVCCCAVRGGCSVGILVSHRSCGLGHIRGFRYHPVRLQTGAQSCNQPVLQRRAVIIRPVDVQVLFKMDKAGYGDLIRWKNVQASDDSRAGLDFLGWTREQVRRLQRG